MANLYDAIVIGGGHNGLTAGAYFARAVKPLCPPPITIAS